MISGTNHHPRICFVSPNNYSVLSGREDLGHIGGAEVQQMYIARGLRDDGYRVSFVVKDHGQEDREILHGIEVFKAYRIEDGLPFIRFVHPRITRTWAAMRRADADLYYQRTSDSLTGIVAAYCRWKRRRLVFSTGAHGDCTPELPFCRARRERVLYRYGLRCADAVVAQTVTQQQALRKHYNVASILIPSCTLEPSGGCVRPNQHQRSVVWIGRFTPEKRLGLLLDVAERCQDITFNVVGDSPAAKAVDSLRQRAARSTNVRLHGYVPHHRISEFYDGASALICTSLSEGFPNTFLEAWSRRLPVVTSFDPDGVVERFQLGLVATTRESLTGAVRGICSDDSMWAKLAHNAQDYYRREHTVEAVVAKYERLFTQLQSPGAAPIRGSRQKLGAMLP